MPDYVELSTSPEDFMNSKGKTTCELIINDQVIGKEESLSGYASCSGIAK